MIQHLCVLFAGVFVFFTQGPKFVWHLWDHLYEGGDSFINSWILAWNAHCLFRPGVSIWDAPIFYPVENALAFSETMFGNLWLTLPVQYLTDNPTFTANMLLLTSFVLGTYFVFLLVHDQTKNFWAGLIAGVVFSFSPYRWGHAGHLQLLPFFWAPLALIFANRFMQEPKKGYLFGMVITTCIQYYTSIYLGTMLLTLLIVLFLVNLILERKGSERWIYFTKPRLRNSLITCFVFSFLVLLPLGIPYLKTAEAWLFVRTLEDNVTYSAEPLSFLLRPFNFANYGWLNRIFAGQIRGGEGAVFLGLTPWILAVVGLVIIRARGSCLTTSQKQVAYRYAWTALIMGTLMLGPYLIFFNHNTEVPMPYQLVYYLLPGAKAIRVPARFVQPLLLCLVVVGGFAIAALFDRCKRWSAVLRVLTIIVFSILFSLDYAVRDNAGVLAETKDRFPPVYSYLAKGASNRPVLELPVGQAGRSWSAFKYLHYQTAHWRPSLSGMSGWHPSGRWALSEYTVNCPSGECFRFINMTPAMTLVVHLDRYSDAERLAWQAADLSPYGFKFVDQMGDSLVWEREYDNKQFSEKLALVWAQWSTEKDGIDVSIILQPAEKDKPWRYLVKGWSDISILVTTKHGKKFKYTKSFKVPPYILPGKRVMVKLPKIKAVHEDIAKIQFEGVLLVDYDLEYIGMPNALRAANGHYVYAEGGGGKELVANRDVIGEWEIFNLVDLGDSRVAFQAANGQYV